MSGQLSPDGHYYWDGTQWARAVSPDGAWRWDGRAWRPAGQAASRTSGRTAALIAAGVIVALLVSGVAIYFIGRAALNAQNNLQSSFSPTCRGTADLPGATLNSGDKVCGQTLGAQQLVADCINAGSFPEGLDVWQQGKNDANASQGVPLTIDQDGCDMPVPAAMMMGVRSNDAYPPGVVVVADFLPDTEAGRIGLQLACSDKGCIDLYVSLSGSTYVLSQMNATGHWTTLARGALPIFALASRVQAVNRVVLMFTADSFARAYLNGYPVEATKIPIEPASGGVDFYIDNRSGTSAKEMHLQTLYAFDAG